MRDRGSLTFFAGNMSSSKSPSLINKALDMINPGGAKVIAFKPDADTRSPKGLIRSRRGDEMKAIEIPVGEPQKILEILEAKEKELGEKIDALVFDEVQFYTANSGFFEIVKGLLDRGYDILAAGLTFNFRGEPFGSTPALIALAQKNVVWCNARCTFKVGDKPCNEEAMFPQRFNHDGTLAPYDAEEIAVGDEDKRRACYYEARCAGHFVIPRKSAVTEKK